LSAVSDVLSARIEDERAESDYNKKFDARGGNGGTGNGRYCWLEN